MGQHPGRPEVRSKCLRKIAQRSWRYKVQRLGRQIAPRIGRILQRTGPASLVHGVIIAAMTVAASCAGPTGWVKMEYPLEISWRDDGSALRLSNAIAGSIGYFKRLPPETQFRYDTLTYSPSEMIQSLELFRDLYVSAQERDAFEEALAEKFHVFESVRGQEPEDNLFTGYYEPELEASDQPTGYLNAPLFALPGDMVRAQLDRFSDALPRRTLVGRVVNGELIPYYTREEIQQGGALAKLAEPIAYVNEIDLFFLQIQGSGVLRYSDDRRVKVGYAASNGHPYRSIGGILLRDNLLTQEEMSMQSIRTYLSRNPGQARELLFANPSYVFFQVREAGPFGNIGVALTPGRSLALDKNLFPKGGLAYVDTEISDPDALGENYPWQRFMLVQDTGGAIQGHGRGDLFLGAGKRAEWQAGHQKHPGRLFLLVAKKEFLPKQ